MAVTCEFCLVLIYVYIAPKWSLFANSVTYRGAFGAPKRILTETSRPGKLSFFAHNVVKRHFDGYLIPLRLLWLLVCKCRNGSEEVVPGVLFFHVALVALPDPQPR